MSNVDRRCLRLFRQCLEIFFVALCSQSLSAENRITSVAANHFGAFGSDRLTVSAFPLRHQHLKAMLGEAQPPRRRHNYRKGTGKPHRSGFLWLSSLIKREIREAFSPPGLPAFQAGPGDFIRPCVQMFGRRLNITPSLFRLPGAPAGVPRDFRTVHILTHRLWSVRTVQHLIHNLWFAFNQKLGLCQN